jgi:hypothetical protein
MTNYHLTSPFIHPACTVQEAREKRRQVLARAAQTRKANYLRFLKKRQLQASSELARMA